MRRASELFNEQQRQRIEQAVGEAEARTSCEIVPAVATSSGRYDRPEDLIGLWLAVAAAVAIWLLFPRPADESGSWGGWPSYAGVLALVAGIVVAFLVGAVIGSRIGWLRRLFTPRQQLIEEVYSRSREVFFDKRVHHTSGASGLLIYVSLFEHTAVILGDQEILDQLGQSFLDQLCEQLTAGLARHNPTEALCQVIAAAGEQLSTALPRQRRRQRIAG